MQEQRPVAFGRGAAPSFAFYRLVGRTRLRIDAAVAILVLPAAVPEFGALDTVGHLPLVAALLVVVLHDPTPLQRFGRVSYTP